MGEHMGRVDLQSKVFKSVHPIEIEVYTDNHYYDKEAKLIFHAIEKDLSEWVKQYKSVDYLPWGRVYINVRDKANL